MTVFMVASKAKIVLRYMGIGLRFGVGFETSRFVKNRAPIWNKSGYDFWHAPPEF